MSSKVDQQQTTTPSSSLDTVKLAVAAILLLAGIAGFYYFETWKGEPVSLFFRVLGLLAVVGIASFIALKTATGSQLLSFLKDSRNEVRKMVWPTRAETLQTTLMVFVIVTILSIFLWLVDMVLGWGIHALLGR